jgi:hypothetical protein
MKFKPPPAFPLGDNFKSFMKFLKVHRGFIPTKKGDFNPPKKSETPNVPLGSVFSFFYSFLFGKFQKLSYGS